MFHKGMTCTDNLEMKQLHSFKPGMTIGVIANLIQNAEHAFPSSFGSVWFRHRKGSRSPAFLAGIRLKKLRRPFVCRVRRLMATSFALEMTVVSQMQSLPA